MFSLSSAAAFPDLPQEEFLPEEEVDFPQFGRENSTAGLCLSWSHRLLSVNCCREFWLLGTLKLTSLTSDNNPKAHGKWSCEEVEGYRVHRV